MKSEQKSDWDGTASDGGREDRDDEKNRDRSRRGDRPSRFSGGNSVRERSPRDRKRNAGDRRIYVSNIAYEYRWQELKDLFRQEVGEVSYVELFVDENDKPRGCGIVEFETPELAKKAVQKMHRYDLKGRKLVVKEDFDCERDKQGRPLTGGNRSDSRGQPPSRQREERPNWGSSGSAPGPVSNQPQNKWGNTYGLSPQFLESLWIQGPLVSRVFVANLDYKVDQKKLKEVFKLAGRVVRCELSLDKDGKSRGFGIVEYEHPVEAVQAISMLHNQVLFDRRITVRMDRADKPDGPIKLPEGLKGIGMGLGSNGQPLQDVARNLPSLTMNNNVGAGAVNIPASVPTPLAAAAALGVGLGSGMGANTVTGLAGAGVDRFLDNSARRQMDIVPGGLGGGGASALGGVLPAGGASDLGLGVGGGGYGSGIGNPGFSAGQIGGPQNNYMGNTGGVGNLAPSSRDFDTLSAALSGGYNNQVSDREFRSNRGVGGGGSGIGGGSNVAGSGAANVGQMSDTIIIRNLSNVTWQQLKDKFAEAGDVKYAEVRGKDMGLVQFASTWEASRAINLFDRTRWDGRSLDIRFY
ncbi:heterogeneous nuclear ribonucleoprotein rumpelstiltskin isoform X2 [Lycorma delicatula]|uniref:heterogeneous nuclear ribonucleoprotein rumpelstiltskin isoform X2 n=1 Tax=Lycorma delicatula TaxID=130591 RepID=UPI003F518FDD